VVKDINNLKEEFKNQHDAKLEEIKLYPTPVSNNLNISYEAETSQEVEIQIFSSLGIKVFNSKYSSIIGKQVSSLNVEILPSGVYTLKLNINSQSQSKTFIKI
jgi:hypothetical protein